MFPLDTLKNIRKLKVRREPQGNTGSKGGYKAAATSKMELFVIIGLMRHWRMFCYLVHFCVEYQNYSQY